MKIERLSENQIRCTLNKADLVGRELLLSELAYRTDKAKELFSDLMKKASIELGFEVDNIPLMIEAIPVSADCLILVITKVEDPEELDTRFSRFTEPPMRPDFEDDESFGDMEDMRGGFTSDVYDSEEGNQSLESILDEELEKISKAKTAPKSEKPSQTALVYAFKTLDDVIVLSKLINKSFIIENTLYKSSFDDRFYLYLKSSEGENNKLVKIVDTMREYGQKVNLTPSTKAHYEEHFKKIVDKDALQTLAKL